MGSPKYSKSPKKSQKWYPNERSCTILEKTFSNLVEWATNMCSSSGCDVSFVTSFWDYSPTFAMKSPIWTSKMRGRTPLGVSTHTLSYSILVCRSRIRAQNWPATSVRSPNGNPKILKKSIFYKEIWDFEVKNESPQRGDVCPLILYLTLFWALLLESGLRIDVRLV